MLRKHLFRLVETHYIIGLDSEAKKYAAILDTTINRVTGMIHIKF